MIAESQVQRKVRAHRVLLRIFTQTLTFLRDHGGMRETASAATSWNPADFRFQPMLSALPVTGAVSGTVFLSLGENAVREVMRRMIEMPVAMARDEESGMLRDTLNEVLNIVVGNSTQLLREDGLPIRMFQPVAMERCAEDDPISLSGELICARTTETTAGPVLVLFASAAETQKR